MINDDVLLYVARMIGIAGLGLLIVSGVGGVLLASRMAQKIKVKWLRGKTFKYHRLLSLIGSALFVLHPIPMIFANQTTEMSWWHIFVPFTAPKQTLLIGLGSVAAITLLIVTVTSIYIKYMNRQVWRAIHYGTYAVLFLGLVHGLFISGEFKPGEIFEFGEPEKMLLMFMTAVALAFPVWRAVIIYRNKIKTTDAL